MEAIDVICGECGAQPTRKCRSRQGLGPEVGYFHQVRSFEAQRRNTVAEIRERQERRGDGEPA
jgi:hypothetical protein